MKANQQFSIRVSAMAVHAALIVMVLVPAANAEDATVTSLTQPTSSIEVGVGSVSKDSAKFGEYNGLNKKDAYGIVNFDLRGGGSYDSNDATRWRVTGTDLGLDTRDIKAEYGQQGVFRVNFGYDELQRNRSDSYQTPYNGAGSNRLTLPGNWVVPVVPTVSATAINARGLSGDVASAPGAPQAGGRFTTSLPALPTAAQRAVSQNIINNDVPVFHNVDLHTKREKTDFGFSFNIDPQVEFKFSMRHEDKTGAKPMGTVTRQTGGDISAIIPDRIDQKTDQFSASVNYTGDRSFAQAAYYGSLFHNNVRSMTWQNWATPTAQFNTMSSAPSNEFHQFSFTGGYNFSRTTKLVVGGSYARNTQNDSFLTDASTPVVPVSSLNGLVVTKAFNLKLTGRPSNELSLSGAYKYDDRDNRTQVHTYQYADASEAAAGYANLPGTLAQNANANRPYSKKLHQFNFDADYRVATGQWIKGGLDWQKIDRSCNGTWINCVDADSTKESTLRLEYRANMMESVSGRIGYAHSRRTVSNYNENAFLALVPYANVVPTGQTISAYQAMQLAGLTGFGPVSGYNGGVFAGSGLTAAQAAAFFPSNNNLPNALYANNNRISELIGMRRYNMADRNRDKLRSSISWQATDKFSTQAGLSYNKDDYSNSAYGLQEAKSWALNLDGTYAPSENFSFTGFYTYEDQRSRSAGNTFSANSNTANIGGYTIVSGGCYNTVLARNNNAKTDPCNNWSATMRDKVHTLGLTMKQNNLLAGKLELSGSLAFTLANSDNNVGGGGNYVTNALAVAPNPVATTPAVFFTPATPLPTVSTRTIDFSVAGHYTIDQQRSVRIGYTWARLKSTDYAYDGMQLGGLAGVLPSMEQAPSYVVQMIGAAFIYSFQ